THPVPDKPRRFGSVRDRLRRAGWVTAPLRAVAIGCRWSISQWEAESFPGACDDCTGVRGRGLDLVLRGPQGRPACFAPVLSLVLGPQHLCWTHEGFIGASRFASTGGRQVHSRAGRSNAAASRSSGRTHRSISFARQPWLIVL